MIRRHRFASRRKNGGAESSSQLSYVCRNAYQNSNSDQVIPSPLRGPGEYTCSSRSSLFFRLLTLKLIDKILFEPFQVPSVVHYFRLGRLYFLDSPVQFDQFQSTGLILQDLGERLPFSRSNPALANRG